MFYNVAYCSICNNNTPTNFHQGGWGPLERRNCTLCSAQPDIFTQQGCSIFETNVAHYLVVQLLSPLWSTCQHLPPSIAEIDRLLLILKNINEQWWYVWKRNTSPTQKIVEGVFDWKYLVPILFSIGNIFCQCGILSVTAATGWSHLKRLIERHKMADRYIQSISRILLDIFLISEENQNSFATNGIMLQVIMTANLHHRILLLLWIFCNCCLTFTSN